MTTSNTIASSAFRLLASAVLSVSVSVAAHAEIRWIEKDFDFGLMREEAGPRSGRSRFVNLGPDSISIFSVKPSCGCTSADFLQDIIAPGDTAWISYTYDPHMRPGKFDKSVKVRLSNADRHTIRITGNVLGTPESVATLFPTDAGLLRLSEAVVNAGDVTMGRSPLLFVNAYSMAPDSIHPVLRPAEPALAVEPSAGEAGPGDILAFSLSFDSQRLGKFGPVEIPVTITPDPKNDSEPFTLYFRAFVLPDTQRLLAQQKGLHPRAKLISEILSLDLPDAPDRRPKSVDASFTISNQGDAPLRILRIAPASDAVTVKKAPETIKPGREATVSLKIDTSSLPDGHARIPVDIVSTDPDHPRLTLNIAF